MKEASGGEEEGAAAGEGWLRIAAGT